MYNLIGGNTLKKSRTKLIDEILTYQDSCSQMIIQMISGIIQASSDLKCGSCINVLIFHNSWSLY